MRNVIIILLLAVLITGPLAAPIMTTAGLDGSCHAIVVADEKGPGTFLDGIDWDEWFDNLLDGIDWDEWFDCLGLKPADKA